MPQRLLIVATMLLLLIGLPSTPVSAAQMVTGTPTWQTVPDTSGMTGYDTTANGQEYFIQTTTDPSTGQTINEAEYAVLGRQYGYYWTDTSGDNLFIIVDPTTGQPISAYINGSSIGSATKTVNQTVDEYVGITPPAMQTLEYPAGAPAWSVIPPLQQNANGQAIPFNVNVLSIDPYWNFAVWQIDNPHNFPENVQIEATVGYGDTSTNVQVPANYNGYLYIPVTQTGYSSSPGIANIVVNSVVGSDGNTYPVYGPQGNYVWGEVFPSPLDITLTSTGLPSTTTANLVEYTNGYYTFQKFQPVLSSVMGDLQNVSVPGQIVTPLTIDLPNVSVDSSAVTITGGGPQYIYGWDPNTYQYQYYYDTIYTGYMNAILVNDTPLRATFNGGSIGNLYLWVRTYPQYTSAVEGSGTLSVPSGIIVPPNGSVAVQVGLSLDFGTNYVPLEYGNGSYPLGGFGNWNEDNPGGYLDTYGSVTLTSVDGNSYMFHNATHYVGSGYQYGDFWDGREWNSLGSPIDNYPSTTLYLPFRSI